ncbi:MAG TPA: hypothetical protein VNX28_19645 [Gemmataceae bacterium]|jgi:hypothetical protein|nr:hypothetical protein [Gemmataceae bacterium]
MKLVQFASVTVLVGALAAIVFFSDRRAAGQDFPVAASPPQPTAETPAGDVFSNHPIATGAQPLYTFNFDRGDGQDPEIRKLHNEEATLEREAAGVVKEYIKTDNEAQRGKLKTKLSDVLAKEFDLQQKRREIELARLETHMKKLRDMMNKRNTARRTIVEQRLDQLLREAEGLGWNAPAKTSPYTNLTSPVNMFPNDRAR